MQADGRVLIDTKISTDGMEKGFDRLVKSMDSVGDHAKETGNRIRSAFDGVDVGKPINRALENARYKVQQLEQQFEKLNVDRKYATGDKDLAQIDAQRARVYDRLAEARRRLAMAVEDAAIKEARAEEKASKRKIKAAQQEEKAQKKRLKETTKGLVKIKARASAIVLGSLIYNTIGQAVVSLINYLGSALKANEDFRESAARLKGALLTAFQPIYEIVAPALVYLMDLLTVATTVIGRFFASITGRNYEEMKKNAEALYQQADGIDAVGDSAKKAKKALAGFDEINRISIPDSGQTGSGSKKDTEPITPNFGFSGSIDPQLDENLNKVLTIVQNVAAALLGWKISSLFTNDLSKVAGISLAIGSAFEFSTNWMDAFENGINWKNLTKMILSLSGVVAGLTLAFGSVGAAIALLVGGFALIVLAVKEWIETGELGEESCAALVLGIMAIGTALSLITGGPIPLIIAAIGAFCVAAVTNGDKIKEALQKLDDWLIGVFSKDWREVFGPVLGGILNEFFGIVEKFWKMIKGVLEGFIDFVKSVFTGDWKGAFEALGKILKTVFGGFKDILLAPFKALQTFIYDLARKYLPDTWKQGINAVISTVNRFISWLNDKLTFDIPPIEIAGRTIFGGATVSLVNIPKIPMLAKGAVIPGGQPFAAILGDQPRGQTNIEAPLATIEEAVERVMARHGGMGDERIISLLSQILEAVLGIEIDGEMLSNAVENYRRKRAVSVGGGV